MVGLFLHREGWFATPPAPLVTTQSFKPQDQWMGIYLDGDKRVGHLRMATEEGEQDGLPGHRLKLDVRLETKLFGLAARLDVNGTAWSARTGDRSDFNLDVVSGDYRMAIEGRLAEGRLRGTMQTGGEAIPLDMPVSGANLTGGSLGMPGAGMPLLAPGETATLPAFDPLTMKMGEAVVACIGEEQLSAGGQEYATLVYTTTVGTITSQAWVTPEGEVIQATTPFGFTLRKIAPESVEEPLPEDGEGDLFRAVAIVPTGKPLFTDAARMSVRIAGIDPETVPDDPPWQIRQGDRVEIRQPEPLPAPDDVVAPPDFDPAPYLGSDPFVASDHPTIRAKAREIVGDETNPGVQSHLLYQWLFENVEKVPVLSIPNALETLRTRQGDCNEHAVLFTALARALNIPCRIAIGVVYSDTLGGFGYHAWPEVYHGAWYPIDPTLGQMAADATHIKLFNGNIESWVQLIGFVGQLEIEVIDVA